MNEHNGRGLVMITGASSGIGATKAYVLNFTQALQQELGTRGVRVQAVLPGATRTELWARSGTDISSLPPSMVMAVDEMVDAALAGLDLGETVTIPSLPDSADWEAFTAMRLSLAPKLSLEHAAPRYAKSATPSDPSAGQAGRPAPDRRAARTADAASH